MFKKSLSVLLLSAMIFSTFSVMPVLAENGGNNPTAGSIIKGKGSPALYYVGEDGKRYVFPNSKAYFSWFDDFSGVEEVEFEDLSKYELAGNVRYKPGALLLKIATDPKVYAVGANGNLRWVKTEKIAKALYGKDWNKLIDDVPVQFFGNYKKGDPIENEEEFEPTEEEGQAPTISHNRGFKSLIKIRKRTKVQNMCGRLEGSLERLQKRFARWGADITDEADEVLDKCYDIRDNIIDQIKDKKVTICHKGETLSVGAPAIKGHLRHGDTLGECEGVDSSDDDDSDDQDDDDDSDDSDDDDDDQDDDQDDTDTTAPVLSNIEVEAGETNATVTWTTDEDSDSEVEYAMDTFSNVTSTMVATDSTTTTSHTIELTGLTASTTYYYVVKSTDTNSNQATSTEMTFTTLEEVVVDETAPVISNIVATPSATSTAISWDTDEDSNSKVYYALESFVTATSTFDVLDDTMVMSHSLNLMDLATSTQYFYYVESGDAGGNTATSTEDTFTTLSE